MGTCYSKSGHEAATSDRDKLPRDKKKRSYKNGHTGSRKNPKLIIEDCDSVQKDVSDTVYTEDSHFIQGTDIDNCINKSQQTSLDQLVRDANKNIDFDTFCPNSTRDDDVTEEEEEDFLMVDEKKDQQDLDNGISDVVARTVLREKLEHLDAAERDGKVSTSDSGIVVESCRACDKTELLNGDLKDEYSEKFETRVDSIDSETVSESIECAETEIENKSACTCSNSIRDYNGRLNQTEHSNVSGYHGECQGHYFSRSYSNASSESLLKSSMKKGNSQMRRKKRLSWKSADSLNWLDSMAISLDRTKSVCSSILGDDISLLNAPLATFDSIDFALGNSYDFSKHIGESMKNRVDYSSDTFQFQFDFSGLEGDKRQSVSSTDRLSESIKTTESSTDLDKIKLAIRQSSAGTPTEHRSFLDGSEASFELQSAVQQPEVTTMTMNGRDVVVIDADLFSQIIDEIQHLKMKLSQLTEVIQDEEVVSGRSSESILSTSA